LLGYSAHEVYNMHSTEYSAYRRWMNEWLPHILYGASAVASEDAAAGKPTALSELPGGSIVRNV
jgi:hypothetical protein